MAAVSTKLELLDKLQVNCVKSWQNLKTELMTQVSPVMSMTLIVSNPLKENNLVYMLIKAIYALKLKWFQI